MVSSTNYVISRRGVGQQKITKDYIGEGGMGSAKVYIILFFKNYI